MQQRVNFILMIAVVLLLIGIGVQTIVGYRQSAKALEAMNAMADEIGHLRAGMPGAAAS